jgi:hypothetical protein
MDVNRIDKAVVRAARLQRGVHPCGALQFIRAPEGGGSLEGFR